MTQQLRSLLILLTFLVSSLYADPASDFEKGNETLLREASPFEDMVEFALTKDDAGLAESLTAAKSAAPAVRGALSEHDAVRFGALLRAIDEAAAAKQHHAVATMAVEVFRLLIDNLKTDILVAPKEIHLLDYAGFKLHVLAAAPKMDWEAMRRTVVDAAGWWTAIKSKVSDTGLRDAFDTTVRGLQEAGQAEHLPMMNFAAQMDLDLVDLLENFLSTRHNENPVTP